MNEPAAAPPSWQRLLRDGVVGSAVVNAILNGAIGWAITRAAPRVPLWGPTSIAFDTAATMFGVAFGTVLATTAQVRSRTPESPAPWQGFVTRSSAGLPSDAVLRSVLLGLLWLLPAPLLIAGFVMGGISELGAPAFIAYKTVLSTAEGAAAAALATLAVAAQPATPNRFDRMMRAFVASCRNALARLSRRHAAGLAALLALPTLTTGLSLDDYYHRLLILGDAGVQRVGRSYPTLYSIANGNPTENLWLAEQGYGPWWILPDLKVAFWRPLSELTHRLDYWLWPEHPLLMHAQNVLWFCGSVLAVATLYRAVSSRTAVTGLATLLFVLDHTHALPVGWIANRNALVGLCLGAVALGGFVRWRQSQRRRHGLIAALALLASLLSSEAGLAVIAYAAAYAVCLDRAPIRSRCLSLLPLVVVVIVWRLVYRGLGYGAHGSGLYIDPLIDPAYFVAALGERLPLLTLGQFALPPAEAYYFLPAPLPRALWVGGWLVLLGVFAALGPLLLRSRVVRFWALGTAVTLIPACSTYASNRLLTFVSIGAMALLAELGAEIGRSLGHATRTPLGELLPRAFALGLLGVHLLAAPVLLVIFARLPLQITRAVDERAVASAIGSTDVENQDIVITSAPDMSYVNQIRFVQSVRGGPQPRRLRALSLGPVALTVSRLDRRTLDVHYEGGLLSWALSQLYRDARFALPVGHRVVLDGMEVTVTAVTGSGLPRSVRFQFDRPLDSDDFKWLTWQSDRYVPFPVPDVGASVSVAPATNPLAPDGARRGANPAASR